MTADLSFTYVGINPCGCVGVLIVDSQDHKQHVAQEVGRMIQDGMTVERIPTERVRSPGFTLKPCADNPDCVRVAQRQSPQRQSAQREPVPTQTALFG